MTGSPPTLFIFKLLHHTIGSLSSEIFPVLFIAINYGCYINTLFYCTQLLCMYHMTLLQEWCVIW